MKRLATALLVLLTPALTFAADADDEALTLAKKLTTEGAATFDRKDAAAMAAYYLEDAQVRLISKDQNTGEVKIDVRRGRSDIQDLYADLFKGDKTVQSKNIVEHARLISLDFLVISGTFEITQDSQTSRFPFLQVRVRQGDKWLMSSVDIFLTPNN